MKLVLLVFMCCLAGSLALPTLSTASAEWAKFKQMYKKAYKNVAEDVMRLKIYLQNKLAILAHNAKYKLKQSPFQVKMNHFGDLLRHEFSAIYNGFKNAIAKHNAKHTKTGRGQPATVDLRRSNLVNTPKQQGTCGSCWTFSTTGALEGALAKKTGKLINLSQQNLLDCAGGINDGCHGGRPDAAFDFVTSQGGINPDSVYPYTGRQGRCRFNPRQALAQVSYYVDVESDSDLADAIANIGPVSIGIDASSDLFRFYDSGIFAPSPSECSSTKLDHAVLAVGYGVERGYPYWLVKNSWGTDWGEGGFVKIYNNGRNLCGVTSMACYPVLK